MTRSLETMANLTLIATCAVAIVVLVRLGASKPTRHGDTDPIRVGQMITGLDASVYNKSPHTLLMYLRSGCQFCTDSMPFYRHLRGVVSSETVRLVVVTGDAPTMARDYLVRHALVVDEVVTMPNSMPTPMLVLVNSSGVVAKWWLGQLERSTEDEVLAATGSQ
jgi:hypothetical protein